MTTSGPLAAGTGANVNDGGSRAWANPGNITADDSGYAIASSVGNLFPTQILAASNFGHALIDVAHIDGIEFTVKRHATASFGSPSVQDATIQASKDGGSTGVGNNKADTSTNWPASSTAVTYGGPTDLWGTTWTEAEIESANFGLRIKAQSTAFSFYGANVNYVESTIYYTQTGGGSPAVSTRRLGLLGVG